MLKRSSDDINHSQVFNNKEFYLVVFLFFSLICSWCGREAVVESVIRFFFFFFFI